MPDRQRPDLFTLLSLPVRLLWNRPLGLRVKLIVAALLVALPSFLLTIVGDGIIIQQRVSEAPRTELAIATTNANLVDATIENATAVAWAVADMPPTQSLDPATLDPSLGRLQTGESQVANIVVFNAQGQSVGEMVPYPGGAPRQNVAERPFFQQALATNAPSVSGVESNQRTGQPAIVVGVPIDGSNGRPRGVAAVVVDLSVLGDRLAAATGTSEVMLLVDPSGRLAVARGISPLPSSTDLASAPLIQAARTSGSATQDSGAVPPLEGSWLGAARQSARYHWIAAVLQPPGSILGRFGPGVWFEIAALIVAIILAAIAAQYVAGQVIHPVHALERAARAWSQGDLNERVALSQDGTLGELGSTFNHMAASLSGTVERLNVADRNLFNQRNRLRAIVDTSPVGILVMNPDETVALANPAAETLLGETMVPSRPSREYAVVGRIYHPNGEPFAFDDLPIVRALRTGETIAGADVVIRHPNAWEEHLLVNAAPIRAANGTIVGSVAVFFDVTPLAEEQRLRTEFVVSAAQEFRNPLTVIKGYAEVAMRHAGVQHTEVEGELGRILNAANRLAGLVDQVIQASKLRLPTQVLSHESLDLATLAQRTARDFQEARAPGTYSVDLDVHSVWVSGDPKLLAEALVNLLRQAESAMPAGGTIGVHVSTWDGIATLAVTDHGPAVPQDQIPALFQAFALPGHEANVQRRTTLPLYLAKRIVEESGGWIRAQSNPEGTTITITLPRLEPTPTPAPEHAAEPAASDDAISNGATARREPGRLQ